MKLAYSKEYVEKLVREGRAKVVGFPKVAIIKLRNWKKRGKVDVASWDSGIQKFTNVFSKVMTQEEWEAVG